MRRFVPASLFVLLAALVAGLAIPEARQTAAPARPAPAPLAGRL